MHGRFTTKSSQYCFIRNADFLIEVQRTLDTTNPFVPWQMVCCIQGFLVDDAISLEFVRVMPIADVRCVLGFIV